MGQPLPEFNAPDVHTSRRKVPWLLIYDNCDDEKLGLSSYLPQCDYGCIIITTRLRSFEQLQPDSAVTLDTMSSEEAIETLKHYSRQGGRRFRHGTSDGDQEIMKNIARKLGYLPLALVQAASHVYESKESWSEYLQNLQKNMNRLMSKSAKSQRDGNTMSAFSAFQSTYTRLPQLAQRLLPLLSFFPSPSVPLDVIGIAAQGLFRKEYQNYQLPRPVIYDRSITLLEECLFQDDKWDAFAFNEAMLALQNYSLVLMTRSYGVRLLYMHPLVQAWARTLLFNSRPRKEYEEAILRVLAAGACEEGGVIDQHLVRHILRAQVEWETVHPNDKAAFAAILHRAGDFTSGLKLRNAVYHAVKMHFELDTPISEVMQAKALNELAESHRAVGDNVLARKIYYKVYSDSLKSGGVFQPHVIEALNNYIDSLDGYVDEAKVRLGKTFLENMQYGLRRNPNFGSEHEVTMETTARLAAICHRIGDYAQAERIQQYVIEYRRRRFGNDNAATMDAYETMGRIYTALERHEDAKALLHDVALWREGRLGPHHRDTIKARTYLAKAQLQMQQYKDAVRTFQAILNCQIRTLGHSHIETAQTKVNLAWAFLAMGKWGKAQKLAKEGQDVIKEMLGIDHEQYLSTGRLIKKIRRVCHNYGFINGHRPVTGKLVEPNEISDEVPA